MGALIGCLLFAVGCGGDSEGTAASADSSFPAASAAFVKEASEVCRIGAGRRAMILEEARLAGKVGYEGKETLKQRQRKADLVWTLDQTMLGELELMKVRPADTPAQRALANALKERIASVKSSRSVAVPAPKLDRIVADYGLEGCVY